MRLRRLENKVLTVAENNHGALCNAKCGTVVHIFSKKCGTRMSKKMPVIKFLFDRRKKATESIPASVELEIYFDRSHRKRIATDVKICLGQWDEKLHVINRPDGLKLNARLTSLRKEQEDILTEMYAQGIALTLDNYETLARNDGSDMDIRSGSFLDFMQQRIQERNLREGTKRTQTVALDALRRFGRIHAFSSLTSANIYAFDMFLRRENPGRDQTTLHNYHKRIKVYVNEAYKLGYIPENPYNHFEDKRGRYKPRKPLTRDELEALRSLPLSGRLDRVRDLFVFCCYTGLAVADLAAFSYEQHVVERNGMLYIDGNRIKTGTEFFTPLLKPARDILTKYDNKLPVISGQKYNDYLHVIEAKLGLKKPLTSHVARHTFATTVCLGNDIPIETVSKMLGHRHVSTTEIYAKVLQENVERAARSLDDIL